MSVAMPFLTLRVAIAALALAAPLCAASAAADTYLVGCGMTDITGPPVGVKMLGYVRPDQITEGIHLRQFSRAFIVAQDDRRLAIVTTDLQSVTHSLVLSVLDALRPTLGDAYRLDNVVIAATHTHAVPGGYWHYGSDTPLGAPFQPAHYQALVEVIAASIVAAHRDLRPGRILVATGDVEGAGAQRSRAAYLHNPADERGRHPADIDTAMTLLKFERDGCPIGILNWHAVHPTSMSYHNRLISSDNKGAAAWFFERAHSRAGGSAPFVAAFAQSNCGDVTPNLTLNQRGPGDDEFQSTRIIAERQCRAAERLCASASEEIAGPLDYRQTYVDFANLVVRDALTGRGDQTTCPACYGYSFGAGSTEDGGGQPLLFAEGMLRTDRLNETLAKNFVPLTPPSDTLRRAQHPKPILLAVGAADPPQLPHVLPLSVARIGQLALVVGPAEYTTMSGRRFREAMKRVMPGVKYVVVAGYANDYAGYVATREEYEAQHYEGAATLFGPWTQAGYQQEFVRLAEDILAGRPSQTHEPPVDVRGKVRPVPLGTAHDDLPPGGEFGAVVEDAAERYSRGDLVVASFWSGHPQNGYRPSRRYATIERQENGEWRGVAIDGDWDVKIRWIQPAAAGRKRTAAHVFSVEWSTPPETAPGTYRVKHEGVFKTQTDAQVHEFTAVSRAFEISAR
jgi:neutral ceramidase